MKKLIFLILVILFSCEKESSERKCWDCYYFDNALQTQVRPHEIFCDLTAEQMDTLQYDQGDHNSIGRKCFNMEFPYTKP